MSIYMSYKIYFPVLHYVLELINILERNDFSIARKSTERKEEIFRYMGSDNSLLRFDTNYVVQILRKILSFSFTFGESVINITLHK